MKEIMDPKIKKLVVNSNSKQENNPANNAPNHQELEKKYVHEVYENTAHHFQNVQYKAWPEVKHFLEEQAVGSLVLDVGCGHGKYLNVNKGAFKIGSDHCKQLVNIAVQSGYEVMVCDNLKLPYRSNTFDAVISIGVIHHFTTVERRVEAISELARVLRPEGKLMIYVWALEQSRRKFKSQDVLVPWHLKQKDHKKKERMPSTSSLDEENEAKQTQKEFRKLERNMNSPRKTFTSNYVNSSVLNSKPSDKGHSKIGKKYPDHSLLAQRKRNCVSATMVMPHDNDHEPCSVGSKPSVHCSQNLSESHFISSVYTTSEKCSVPQLCNSVSTNKCSTDTSKYKSKTPMASQETAICAQKTSSDTENRVGLGTYIKKKLAGIFKNDKGKNNGINLNDNSEDKGVNNDELISFQCQLLPLSLCDGFAVREFPKSSQPIDSIDTVINGSENQSFSKDDMSDNLSACDNVIKDYTMMESDLSSQNSSDDSFLHVSLPADENDLTFLNQLQLFNSDEYTSSNESKEDFVQVSNHKVDGSQSDFPIESKLIINSDMKYDNQKDNQIDRELARNGKLFSLNQCAITTDRQKIISKSKIAKSSPKLSLRRKLFHSKRDSDETLPVASEISGSSADLDCTWLKAASNAILKIENELNKTSYNDIVVSNDVFESPCSTPVKTAPSFLRRKFSHSSSLSSFSSDNFSDSEIEDTPLPCGYYVNSGAKPIKTKKGDVKQTFPEIKCTTVQCSENSSGEKEDDSQNMFNVNRDDNSELFKRYYHVFRENELNELITSHMQSIKITSSSYDHANWCVIAEKCCD